MLGSSKHLDLMHLMDMVDATQITQTLMRKVIEKAYKGFTSK